MDTIGIIAEYNPFHNGHLYQIRQIKALTGAKNIVAVMSGDFVQRGTPAWTDKYLRTQMALSQGVDLVFELPVTFATSSAETFARAGISLLSSLGFVDGVCFGGECDNLLLLQEIASFLANPPASFEITIHHLTANGVSYPAARQQALKNFFPEAFEKYPELFSKPNNILALEYLKAIQQLKSPLTPFLIQRKGTGYHSDSLTGSFASATAIRKAGFLDKQEYSFLNTIAPLVPEYVQKLLKEQANRYPITENDFSDLLYYRLLHLTQKDSSILDMTEEILHRIQKKLPAFVSYSDFIPEIKTKQYTYSRISRVLLHCLLDITTDHLSTSYPPYARLLGLRREKSVLLRHKTGIPVITKPADGLAQIHRFYNSIAEETHTSFIMLSKAIPSFYTHNVTDCIHYACGLYQKDIFAANLYRQVQNTHLHSNHPNEYYCQPIIF